VSLERARLKQMGTNKENSERESRGSLKIIMVKAWQVRSYLRRGRVLEELHILIRGKKQDNVSSQNSRNDDIVITAADFAMQKRRKVYEYGSFTQSQVASDKPGTSAGCLLFSFGISIGIMFAIISSWKEIERLKYLLRQTEELVEDLEEEIKMHDSLTVKDLTGEAHNCVETGRDPFAEGHGTRHTSSGNGVASLEGQ
jgi:hypothetical protein